MVLIKSIFIIILLIILYQDLRYQAVSWIFFLLGFGIALYMGISENRSSDVIFYFSTNFLFILFQLGIIFIYSWFKFKSKKNIFKSVFGLGDLLFLIMIIPLFSPFKFVMFFMSSVLFTLLIYFVINALHIYKIERVPLAGLQAGFLILILIIKFFIPFDFYNDFLILDKLNFFS